MPKRICSDLFVCQYLVVVINQLFPKNAFLIHKIFPKICQIDSQLIDLSLVFPPENLGKPISLVALLTGCAPGPASGGQLTGQLRGVARTVGHYQLVLGRCRWESSTIATHYPINHCHCPLFNGQMSTDQLISTGQLVNYMARVHCKPSSVGSQEPVTNHPLWIFIN